jgi:predicted metal-dependent RNase
VHKKKIFVKAEIIQFKSFSGHADCLGLVEYSKQLILKNKRKHTVVFAIHGSRESASCFKEALLAALDNKHYSPDNIIIPKLKQEIALLA